MKHLIILRHGKSECCHFGKEDCNRALTERGKKNATQMGEYISDIWGTPDLILSSSAKRAIDTARLAANELHYLEENIQIDKGLYLTSAYRMLEILSKIDDEIENCILVGHNPALTDLVNLFGVHLDNLPTGSAVYFSFKSERWDQLSAKNAKFEWIKLVREL